MVEELADRKPSADAQHLMAAALVAHGVTNARSAALSALQADPGLSNAELARRSFVTSQTMHQVIAQPERASLTARQPTPTTPASWSGD